MRAYHDFWLTDCTPIAIRHGLRKILRMLFGLHYSAQKVERHLIGWMLLALLLPFYAPWINSNFAALQPNHGHLYFGEPDLAHSHDLSDHGPHGHNDGKEDDVAFLPNFDVTSATAVLLISPFFVLPFALYLSQYVLFNEGWFGLNLFMASPPVPPPRLLV